MLALSMPAQCSGPSCAPAAQPQAAFTGWKWSTGWPGWQLEYIDGILVAGFEPTTGAYQIRNPATDRWRVAAAPWEARGVQNFGIDQSKLGTGPAYSMGGRPCSKDAAMRAIENGLTDDRDLPRLTAIGSEAFRKAVLADLDAAPALTPWKGKLLVNAFPADWWAAADFLAQGDTLILQAPDGRELSRTLGYSCGAAGLARALAAYDPKKTPDLTKPAIPGGVLLWTIIAGIGACIAFAVGGLLIILGRNKAPTTQQVIEETEAVAPRAVYARRQRQAPAAPVETIQAAPPAPAQAFGFNDLIRAEVTRMAREEEEAAARARERKEMHDGAAKVFGFTKPGGAVS